MSTRLFVSAALLTALACKTPGEATHGKAYSATYYHAPTRAYATFSINPASDTGASLTAFNRRWIVSTVRGQMIKKGLTPGDGTADLLVNVVSVDSSKAGQRAGRPLNDWYRLFHGERTVAEAAGPREITGTLLPDRFLGKPDSLLAKSDTLWKQDTFRAAEPPPDTGSPAGSLAYGALVIDVIDKDRRVLLWEGVANRPVDVPARDADRRVSRVVTRLMEGFSPKGGPAGRDTVRPGPEVRASK